jgi:hypothetical protein
MANRKLTDNKLLRLFRAGSSVKEIAEKLGVGAPAVCKRPKALPKNQPLLFTQSSVLGPQSSVLGFLKNLIQLDFGHHRSMVAGICLAA